MSFWNASLYLKETFKVYWWWFPILCSRYKEFFKKKYTVLGDDLNCYFFSSLSSFVRWLSVTKTFGVQLHLLVPLFPLCGSLQFISLGTALAPHVFTSGEDSLTVSLHRMSSSLVRRLFDPLAAWPSVEQTQATDSSKYKHMWQSAGLLCVDPCKANGSWIILHHLETSY